nr:WD40 repeat and Transcription initiation factor IIA domain containing protein [Haemonchus contortus]
MTGDEDLEMEDTEDLASESIEQVIDCSNSLGPNDEQCSSDNDDEQSTSKTASPLLVIAERWLASGGEDDVAFLWDQQVSDCDPVIKIAHDDSVTHVSFNNQQTLLATADMSGEIIITHLSDLSSRAKLNDCNDLEWMCWHTTSDILFAGDKDGMIWMWLIGPSGVAQSKVYSGDGSPCTNGQLLPDGKRLMAGYADGAVRLWNLKDGTFSMLKVNSAVTAIHHHVSKPIGAVGTEAGTVHVINTAHLDRLTAAIEFPALSESKNSDEEQVNVESCVECIQFAPFNSWLAVGRNDGTLCIYETTSTTPRSIYRAPSSQAMVRALWSMEGNTPFLCVGSVDCFLRIFDARDGALYKELGNGADEILDMVILGSNPLRIMTAGSGGIIRVFDLSRISKHISIFTSIVKPPTELYIAQMTYYQMYRNTTLGEALQKTLDDLVHEQMIPPQLAVKVLAIYDKAINKALAQKAKNKMYFKAEKLRAYRHCDNVWTFLMERVDFRDSIRVARVKFVACDGSAKLAST